MIRRDAELKLVREHLRARKNLVVFGVEGVGKTALVAEAMRDRPDALYCADATTLKTACESLLAQLGLAVAEADNVRRKRAILKATAGKNCCFVFDHVGRVGPKLASFLDNIHESQPMIVVTRSLAWKDIGHLKMILYDFDTLKLTNLSETDTRQLVRAKIKQLSLTAPNPAEFEREVWRLSKGNPRLIIELCQQAAKRSYVFGGHLSTQLLDLDRRISKLNPP